MLKPTLIALSLVLCAEIAAADGSASFTIKPQGTNVDPEVNGVAWGSSIGTGNGDVIGGNGTSGADQTTNPGSRAAEVQRILEENGIGRDHSRH